MVFFTLPLVVGCTDWQRGSAELRLIDPQFVWEDGELILRTGLDIELSAAVLEALDNGVAIIFNLQTRSQRSRPWPDRRAIVRNHRFEIRYLPLSRHYQLTNLKLDTQQSFPRLWMLLAALREPIDFDTRLMQASLDDGVWRVRVRAFLDISRLPPPMRLPSWFSSEWKTDSGWHEWSSE